VDHQRSKLALLDLGQYDRQFGASLSARLEPKGVGGKSVLCLAARIGTEVRAFHENGAFAVGIDLEPGAASEFVIHGDFHRLVFPDTCVDIVYCNSLDHALRLDLLLGEVFRVLKPTGQFYADVQHGTEILGEFDEWAVTQWTRVDDLVERIVAAGFRQESRVPIDIPWPGCELVFIRM
jgi:SAM-dependent methyltransferase